MRLFSGVRFLRVARIGILACIALACGAVAQDRLNVVASFSILGDMTQRVGGERVQIHTLVGYDSDAHVYQPTPADARTIARADLVVINGFGFEGWIERLVKSAGYRGKVVVASAGVKTLKRTSTGGPAHDEGAGVDPHAWQDLSNALRYVDNIESALAEVDPKGADRYRANASAFKQEISALDGEIRTSFATIPEARRKVVTSHDAFAYFGRAYGIAFIAPVGINTDAEPSAGGIAKIIRQIRNERIPAVFLESVSDPRLLERIRSESGAHIGGTLYSDSLSKANGPAHSYLDMMRHNAETLSTALTKP